MNKVISSLREATTLSGLRDGMTVSFHHHLRSGDYVLNMVMAEIAAMGLKNITINASSLHDGHAPLTEHIRSGVVTGIETSYIGAKIGQTISAGALQTPVIFQTHGGRASALRRGTSHVDVAFIAAPTADGMGNCTGKLGKSACGALGYAFSDAQYADKVIVITDHLVPYPLTCRSISEVWVDYVVEVDSIGDPAGIVSGTTRLPRDPVSLMIADMAAAAIAASGYLKEGFSFQTGAGGASLATAASLHKIIKRQGIRGSYAYGGVTGYLVDMLNDRCFQSIQDVQCFDLQAVESLRSDPRHVEISAVEYADPFAKSCGASNLDIAVLGATEIDLDFNVNVHTDSYGRIMGGSGGHSDVAESAKLTVIVAPLHRTRIPTILDRVTCISTPGTSVDLFVSQAGAAVNPRRPQMKERLLAAGVPLAGMGALKSRVEALTGVPQPLPRGERIVAEVLTRRGEPLDRIYQTLT